jgi:hypothetical protein
MRQPLTAAEIVGTLALVGLAILALWQDNGFLAFVGAAIYAASLFFPKEIGPGAGSHSPTQPHASRAV